MNEPMLDDTQYYFHLEHNTTDQIFTLQKIFKISWQFAKDVHTCFVDLESIRSSP